MEKLDKLGFSRRENIPEPGDLVGSILLLRDTCGFYSI